MTPKRLALAFMGMLALEVAMFFVTYRDLIPLRTPQAAMAGSSSMDFSRSAGSALERPKLTTAQLESIAAVAQTLRLPDLETRALSRLADTQPDDLEMKLRLADALRRQGDFARGEQVYRSVLDSQSIRK